MVLVANGNLPKATRLFFESDSPLQQLSLKDTIRSLLLELLLQQRP
jgi:hypothetical protein